MSKLSAVHAISFFAFLIFLGCKKENFSTRPHIEIKSISKTSLLFNDYLDVSLKFTDKEGDVQDSIWIERTSIECPFSDTTAEPFGNQTFALQLPSFPKQKSLTGEINFKLRFGNTDNDTNRIYLKACAITDTSTFKIWIRDNEGHYSDTVETPKIILNPN